MKGTGALAAFALCLLASQAVAQSATKLRFSLDWKFEGQNAFVHMAKAKGYYEHEGLDVTVDAGNGSSAAIQRIATGTYDVAIGDLSTLIEFAANNPGPARMQAVYVLYDELPMAYFALKKSGVRSIADLRGKSVVSPSFAASTRLWPLFAKAAGIEPSSVTFMAADPQLLATIVIRGDAVAMGGFRNVLLDFTSRGVAPADVVVMPVADVGVRPYGNALLASSKLIAEQPKALAGFVRATNRALREALADPAGAVKYLKQREPLADEALEVQRFTLLIPAIATDRVRANGLGNAERAVLEKQVAEVGEAYKLKTTPAAETLYNAGFLPPKAERMLIAQ
ncbi:MAG TPA: ABC transporter substrate-binding protein [Burkholderiales bacterium]|nr:ABC transporter substrate-binding protein [Burkholderiales bacterium]